MKLGIRAKLFLVSIGLILSSLLVFYAYTRARLEREVTEGLRADLTVRARLVAHRAAAFAKDLGSLPAADRLADDLGRAARARVTLIGADGVVLGDSEVPLSRLSEVENHGQRPEVLQALAGAVGVSERLSSTVDRRMVYVAVPLSSNASVPGVARVALPLKQVSASLSAFHQLLFVAVLLAFSVAILMSMATAHLVTRTIARLTATARSMAAGDLSARSNVAGSDEFASLGNTLDTLAESLSGSLAAIKAERDRLGGILAGMQEGVLLVDEEQRVLMMNPAIRAMLPLATVDVGRPVAEVIQQPELISAFDQAAREKAPVSAELTIAGAEPREISVRAAPLRGALGGIFAVFVDLTEIRRLESVRREFVANVSHELRTPVAALRSAAETLQLVESDKKAQQSFLAMIERNAERLQDLVEDLLDLSRIESQKTKLDYRTLDVREVFAQALSLFHDRAKKRNVLLEQFVERGALTVNADRKAVDHILINLIDNAIKYVGTGARVSLDARVDDGRVRISVVDNGPGIERSHLPRLFERFYRVDTGRSRDLGGTGLGLSIVKHLVESMGGKVSVESEVGRGTTFHFTLAMGEPARETA